MLLRVWSCSFALALPCAAQAVIVPSLATSKPSVPGGYTSDVFFASATGPSESRTQTLVDVDEIPLAVAVWGSLSVRRPAGGPYNCNAFTANATIVLSHGPNAPAKASATFATNLGTHTTTVFSGAISLPTDKSVAVWPAPWQQPFVFAQPFVFVKTLARSLVVDLKQTANTGVNPWYLELTRSSIDTGARAANGPAPPNCRSSAGSPPVFYSTDTPYAGHLWTSMWSPLPPQAPGVAIFGTQGAGSTWSGVSLPFLLPGTPGCTWSISAELILPVRSEASGLARYLVQLPDDPSLGGGVFFEQAVFSDPAANALGLVTTASNRWTFGDGKAAATLVSSYGGSSNPPGVGLSLAPTWLLR